MVAAFAVLSGGFTLKAQIQAGTILIGGQISYNSTGTTFSFDPKGQKNNSGTYNVSVGKVLKTNAVFGITLGYAPSSFSNFFNGADYVSGNLKMYNMGIFYRQYKMLAKGFYFFTEAGLAYNTFKQTTADTSGANSEVIIQHGVQLTLMPGIAYKITKRLFIEIVMPDFVTVQYFVTTDDLRTTQQFESAKQHQFTLNTSLNSNGLNFLGVGFHFVL